MSTRSRTVSARSLFHRTTRRLTLTEAGQGYLQAAERILAEIEEAEAEAAARRRRAARNAPSEPPLAFGLREVGPGDRRFRRPQSALTIDLGLTDRFIDLVEEGWDLALGSASSAIPRSIARQLAPAVTVLCASPGLSRAPRRAADPRRPRRPQLPRLHAPTPASADAGASAATGSVPVSGTVFAPTTATRSGWRRLPDLGLIYQPTFLLAEDLRQGGWSGPSRPAALPVRARLCRLCADAPRPGQGAQFIDFLAARWAGEPPWDAGLPTAAD